jgi:5-carboxymethyl-2-hydroxymuconate isomerase
MIDLINKLVFIYNQFFCSGKLMPHLIIECNESLAKTLPFKQLALQLHEILARSLPTNLDNCKSRMLTVSEHLIGDRPQKNFLHITLKILPGRNEAIKNSISQDILSLLSQKISISNLSLSLEIIEINPVNYFKVER